MKRIFEIIKLMRRDLNKQLWYVKNDADIWQLSFYSYFFLPIFAISNLITNMQGSYSIW